MMIHKIPKPALNRLSILYQFLNRLENEKIESVSSREIEFQIGISAHTIRKDISYLKAELSGGYKYNVSELIQVIADVLNFNSERNACVIGLGRIGSALLNYQEFKTNGFEIIAGFDSNINKIETIKADCPLFPSYLIEEKVKELQIELAVLAVPHGAVQPTLNRLLKGGIKGIVNFTSAALRCENVYVINNDVTCDFRVLSALISLDKTNTGGTNESL
jgi:redox-sensing transcriptional repressor